LVGEKDNVLFSSDQSKAVYGSSFNDFNSEKWYLHQQPFDINRVISLEPLTSAYSDMFGKLERSISSVSSGTGVYTNSLPIENEPREFEVIRKSYDDALRDLARTAISRDRFENVINSLDEVLMVIDDQGNLILSNLSLEKFLTASFIHKSNDQVSIIERLYDDVDGCTENGESC
jgi:transcriptional regulator with PAS, ATPase and Fis domain